MNEGPALSDPEKSDSGSRTPKRKSQLFYKFASAVEKSVSMDECTLLEVGLSRSGISRKEISKDRVGMEGNKSACIVARRNVDNSQSYEIVQGVNYFEKLKIVDLSQAGPILFPIMIVDLTDEEAFSLAIKEVIEQGHYETLALARTLEKAHRFYYKYGYEWMSRRLGIESRWLKGHIELARFPPEVLSSFESLDDLDTDMILGLSHRLRNYQRRGVIVDRASLIAIDQSERRRLGHPPRSANDVCWDLCNERVSPRARAGKVEVRTTSGCLIACITVKTAGVGSIEVYNPPNISPNERKVALQKAIEILEHTSTT